MSIKKLSTGIDVMVFEPKNPRGIAMNISHGMVEHIGRYEELINKLVNEGITVSSFHYPGHGKLKKLGIMDIKDIEIIKSSILETHELLKKDYNCKKIIQFAHSLGTYFTRSIIAELDVDEIILSGVGYIDNNKVIVSDKIFKPVKVFSKNKKTSKILLKLVFDDFMKPYKKRTGFEFISSLENEVDEYANDPLCSNPISIGMVQLLLKLSLEVVQYEKKLLSISTPITLLSGKEDSIGKNGETVEELKKKYEKINSKPTEMLLFNGRHEILHDISKEEMFTKIIEVCLR